MYHNIYLRKKSMNFIQITEIQILYHMYCLRLSTACLQANIMWIILLFQLTSFFASVDISISVSMFPSCVLPWDIYCAGAGMLLTGCCQMRLFVTLLSGHLVISGQPSLIVLRPHQISRHSHTQLRLELILLHLFTSLRCPKKTKRNDACSNLNCIYIDLH